MIACNLCRNPVSASGEPQVLGVQLGIGSLVLHFYPHPGVNLCTECYKQAAYAQMEIWRDNLKAEMEVRKEKIAELPEGPCSCAGSF